MANKKKELTIVAGCGTLGARVANEIYHSGANVIVIDRHKDAFERLDSSFGGLTVTGDSCDFAVLKRAEIESANTVIAVTDFENNNIFIGQAAKALFNVENVIVRIVDKDKEALCSEMGIRTICPAELSANTVIDFYNGGRQK